mgnify:FL=1
MLKSFSSSALLLLGAGFLAACSTNEVPTPDLPQNTRGHWVLTVNAQSDGSEYVIHADDIEGKTFHIKDNILEMPNKHYTWLSNGKTAVGFSYQQGNPGVGYALGLNPDLTLNKLGEFIVRSRFTNYEYLNDTTFVTSVGGQVSADGKRNDGATFEFWNITPAGGVKLVRRKTLWTSDITGNGEQATFSGIIPLADGTFLSAMVESGYRERNSQNGGSSIGEVSYPDSCWVAQLDTALNVKHIFRDGRQSYAAGQYRSMMMRTLLRADDGKVYAFSNGMHEKTKHPAGALRILPGAKTFDPTYHFNLQEKTNGYKFRRVWHLTGSKFLLEIYNTKNVESLTPGHQFAVADMETQSILWLNNYDKTDLLPNPDLISSGSESGGVPLFHDGYLYLPVTKLSGDAQIYKIDINTGQGKPITTITGAHELRTIIYLQ